MPGRSSSEGRTTQIEDTALDPGQACAELHRTRGPVFPIRASKKEAGNREALCAGQHIWGLPRPF